MRVISVHDILGSPSLLTPRQNHKWLESLNSIFGQPLRDRAADAVAGLDDPADQLGLQQIDFVEPAIPAEDIRIAAIAREYRRRVAEIAESLHFGDGRS